MTRDEKRASLREAFCSRGSRVAAVYPPCDLREQRGTQGDRASPFRWKRGKEVREHLPILLVTLGSLSLPFPWRMASRAKEGEMLSTEELPRNHQLIGSSAALVKLLVRLLPFWIVVGCQLFLIMMTLPALLLFILPTKDRSMAKCS